jgi:regulator of replication initiation timing
VDATLQTVAELFYMDSSQEDAIASRPISRLPEDLQRQVDDIHSMQLESQALSRRLSKLQSKTQNVNYKL